MPRNCPCPSFLDPTWSDAPWPGLDLTCHELNQTWHVTLWFGPNLTRMTLHELNATSFDPPLAGPDLTHNLGLTEPDQTWVEPDLTWQAMSRTRLDLTSHELTPTRPDRHELDQLWPSASQEVCLNQISGNRTGLELYARSNCRTRAALRIEENLSGTSVLVVNRNSI